MKYTREVILDALSIIKETCEENKNCKRCPFGSLDGFSCKVNAILPYGWELNDSETMEWKGLK